MNLNKQFWIVTAMIAAAAGARLIPGIANNFQPIFAIALFSGAILTSRIHAFVIPLTALLLSDIALALLMGPVYGFHSLMPVIYGCFASIVAIGFWIARKRTFGRIVAGCVASTALFFTISNFAVWLAGGLYPRTLGGLVTCYAAAIPFLQTTALGFVFFGGLLFGGYWLLEQRDPTLRPAAPASLA